MSAIHPQTPKIVQPGERRSPVRPLLFFLVLIAVGWVAFEFGLRQSDLRPAHAGGSPAELRQRLEELGRECEEQRALVARYQRASQIDRLAAEKVREEMKALQQSRSELRNKVAFLNSLISGEVTVLQVSQVELNRLSDADSYAFSFMVSKRAKDDVRVNGRVELQIAGQMQGEEAMLTLQELGIEEPMKMGFRHFQKFEGRLRLPDGFVPSALVVVGKPSGKKFKRFEERIKWRVG